MTFCFLRQLKFSQRVFSDEYQRKTLATKVDYISFFIHGKITVDMHYVFPNYRGMDPMMSCMALLFVRAYI